MVKESVPSHYTIYAWGFPENIKNESDVKNHFENFGHV